MLLYKEERPYGNRTKWMVYNFDNGLFIALGEICKVADPAVPGAARQKAEAGPRQLARPAHTGVS